MSEDKRMAEEATRIGHEVQDRTQRMAREYQNAAESGVEAAGRSFSEVNRGFQAVAAEMTDFSKRRWEDILQAWEQLLQARSFGEVVAVQTRYAQKHMRTTCLRYLRSERCISARPAARPSP